MNGEPSLRQANIPGSVVVGLLEIAERLQTNTEGWFAGTGIRAVDVRHGRALLSYRQAESIIERALRSLPDGPMGIAVASRDVQDVWGVLGLALRSCPTVGEALDVGIRHYRAAGTLTDVFVEAGVAEVALRAELRAANPRVERFLVEETFACVMTLCRAWLPPGSEPSRIEFAFPAPAYAGRYRAFFQCPIAFGAAANRMYTPLDVLGQPVRTQNAVELAALLRVLEANADETDTDVVSMVRARIAQNMRGRSGSAQIAKQLQMSERTLQRQLAARGSSFSALRDEVRGERALELLRGTTLPVHRIAEELGYSDTREFGRAFRRWTGRSPTQARAREPASNG
ncbi:MAG: AraC family transcriptional regulator [Segniliparus sp.]|uniref:AraC family transcriptional regulator n=1 Tax=Segniliparus sp. TaxID=2804064 RepID=UPI003F2C21C8